MWNSRAVRVVEQAQNRREATQTWHTPSLPDSNVETGLRWAHYRTMASLRLGEESPRDVRAGIGSTQRTPETDRLIPELIRAALLLVGVIFPSRQQLLAGYL